MADANELLEKIANGLKEVSEEKAKSVVKQVLLDESPRPRTNKKPEGWGRHSNAPYYCEKYALELKKTLDELIRTREPIEFPYEAHRLSKSTLYNKINLAFRYLCDKLDTDGVYSRLAHEVGVSRTRPTGVVIEYKNPDNIEIPLVSRPVEKRKQILSWRERVDNWLETAPMESRHEDNKVSLSADDIAELEGNLSGLKNILFVIKPTRILILKTEQQVT